MNRSQSRRLTVLGSRVLPRTRRKRVARRSSSRCVSSAFCGVRCSRYRVNTSCSVTCARRLLPRRPVVARPSGRRGPSRVSGRGDEVSGTCSPVVLRSRSGCGCYRLVLAPQPSRYVADAPQCTSISSALMPWSLLLAYKMLTHVRYVPLKNGQLLGVKPARTNTWGYDAYMGSFWPLVSGGLSDAYGRISLVTLTSTRGRSSPGSTLLA